MARKSRLRLYVKWAFTAGIFLGMALIFMIQNSAVVTPAASRALSTDSLDAAQSKIPDFAAPKPPQIITTAANILEKLNEASINCADLPCLALTFDDGPDLETTPALLDILNKHEAKTTFFVVGSRIEPRSALVKRIYSEGHEIGNHSWSHANFMKLTPEQAELEFTSTQNAITSLGLPPPKIFRPPYGVRTQSQIDRIKAAIIEWDIDPQDWREHDPDKLARMMIEQAKPGGIMVLHDMKPSTVAAVDKALPELKQRYSLVTVSKLLDLGPDPRGIYFGR